MNNFINDPDFAADVALVTCALNNICQRAQCPFSDSWLAEEAAVPPAGQGHHAAADLGQAAGALVRLALAQDLNGHVPLP